MLVGRSWWGWGDVEDAVTGAEAAALVERTAALVPGHDLTDHAPPDPARLGSPAPRVRPPVALATVCSADPATRAAHAHGKAFRDVVRNLRGRLDHVPDLVAFPRHEQDGVDLLDWGTRAGIALIVHTRGFTHDVRSWAPEPLITPDRHPMRVPAAVRWSVADDDGSPLLAVEAEACGDFTYGLGAGYAGSTRWSGTYRGRPVAASRTKLW